MALRPAGHRLLVIPDPIEEKIGSIYVAIETKERKGNEQIFGTVHKIGPTAFRAFDDGEPWCKEGDHIIYAKHAGAVVEDPDTKQQYRLIQDEDVIIIHEREA